MSEQRPGTAPAITAPAGNDGDTPEEKRFSQAELDSLIKDRLERQRRALETQQREAKEALEAQSLEDQKEFEKLAKQRAKEIDTLKPRASLAASYETGVSKLMLKATESLPSSVQTILNKLSLPDQLDWLAENLDSVRQPQTATPGMDTNAWARGGGGPQNVTDEEFRERKRRESRYT